MHLFGRFRIKRRSVALLAALAVAAVLPMVFASSAGAYGDENGPHQVWQIGFSTNCNNPTPSSCNQFGVQPLGGEWGWIEFDCIQPNPAIPCGGPGTTTWGDGKVAFCRHTEGGGGGAGYSNIEFTHWFAAPGRLGPHTVYVTGVEHEIVQGVRTDVFLTKQQSQFTTDPGHYTNADFADFPQDLPGDTFDEQVTTYFFNPQGPVPGTTGR